MTNSFTADLPCAQQVGGLFVLFYLVNTAFYNISEAAEINIIPIALVRKPIDSISIFRDIDNRSQYDLFPVLAVDGGNSIGASVSDAAFYTHIAAFHFHPPCRC